MSDRLLICSLKKSEWAITLFVALCKRAIERSLAHLLFKKERMSNCSFRRSLQKSDCLLIRSLKKSEWAITLFVALFKRATKRAIALLFFQKERKSKNEQKWAILKIAHFSLKKKEWSLIIYMNKCWAIAHSLNCSSLIFKKAIVQSLAQSLFKNEQSERAIALFKRAM